MHALIVYAHPEPKSFNAAMKERAERTLVDMGWTVEVSDLYALNFNPAAGFDDFTEPSNPDFLKYAVEQTHAAQQENGFAADIQAEIDKLKRADLLILQFPMWWFSFPAILKGWVDRVFAAGVIYGASVGMFSNGLFKGRRALLAFTSGGTAKTYGPTGLYGRMDVVLWPLQNGILNFVGYDVLPHFQAESPARASDAERADILERWERHLRTLDEATPLDFHALEDFDQEHGWTFKPGVEGRTIGQSGDRQTASVRGNERAVELSRGDR